MKKVLLTLFAVVVVLGLFAATGYAGYRLGYVQGAQGIDNGQAPEIRRFDGMGPNRTPRYGFDNRFDRGFERSFGPFGFPVQGFGFFSPLRFLMQVAVLGLLVWFGYWLFRRSGWQLTRTVPTTQTPPPAVTEVKEENRES